MRTNNRKNNFLWRDIAIIILSVMGAAILVKTSVLIRILTSTQELEWLGSFIAGMFFTSVFTTAPAIVTLAEIAQAHSIISTALFGAGGAVMGDLIIFRFVRDRLLEHLTELIKHQGAGKRIGALLRLKHFRWITLLVGGMIIASPLPDELAISLLGLSKTRTSLFVLLSFTFNFIGILLIGLMAKTL